MPDQKQTTRVAVIGVLLIIILLLWLRKGNTTISVSAEYEPPNITLDNYNNFFPLDINRLGDTALNIDINSNGIFDWINSTSIMCNCSAPRGVSADPVLITEYVYITTPSSPPRQFTFGATPNFNKSQIVQETIVRYYEATMAGEGRKSRAIMTSDVATTNEVGFAKLLEKAKANKAAFDARNAFYRASGRPALIEQNTWLNYVRLR